MNFPSRVARQCLTFKGKPPVVAALSVASTTSVYAQKNSCATDTAMNAFGDAAVKDRRYSLNGVKTETTMDRE
ncbi:hypothetical protein PPMP20_26080 [Paraburkholderia phymatum]|nr:hypothetical protein [Paraburkholderia phymatum]